MRRRDIEEIHPRSEIIEIYPVFSFFFPPHIWNRKEINLWTNCHISEIGQASYFVVSDPELLLQKHVALITEMKCYFFGLPRYRSVDALYRKNMLQTCQCLLQCLPSSPSPFKLPRPMLLLIQHFSYLPSVHAILFSAFLLYLLIHLLVYLTKTKFVCWKHSHIL